MSKETEVFVGSLTTQPESDLSLTRVLETEAIRKKIKGVHVVLGGEDNGEDILIQVADIGFGVSIRPEDIKTNSSSIEKSDYTFAGEFGFVILPIACAKLTGGKVDAWISRALVSKQHPLIAQALKIDSPVVITTGEIDDERIDTASETLQQLGISEDFREDFELAFLEAMSEETLEKLVKAAVSISSSRRSGTASSHYVRLTVQDQPGVLGDVAQQFGDAHISIRMAKQPEVEEGSETAQLAFILHPCETKTLEKCIDLIQNLDVCVGVGSVLRVVE